MICTTTETTPMANDEDTKDTDLFAKWSVDRYGRLLSGISMTLFVSLGAIYPPFLAVAATLGCILIITSVTNKCLMHDALISLGAKEREDIFLSGGTLIRTNQAEKTSINRTIIKKEINKRKPSATSQALTLINNELELNKTYWEINEKIDYKIRLASNQNDRQRVFNLAHKIYGDSGYASEEDSSSCIMDYDAQEDTIIFIAEDSSGELIGSITIVSNSFGELPCEEIFKCEISNIKNNHQSLVEITRLVLKENCKNSKSVVKNLMNCIYIYAKNIANASDILIEVNPRHKKFYSKLLCFEVFGNEKPCQRVNGAPAILMKLNIGFAKGKVMESHKPENLNQRKYLQYHFLKGKQELAVENMIRQTHKPMNESEKEYFGLIDYQIHLLTQ